MKQKLQLRRGECTQELITYAKEAHDMRLDVCALGLIPYVQYCIINQTAYDIDKVTGNEIDWLMYWTDAGFLFTVGGDLCVGRPTCTKFFWDFMSDMLWIAYS